MSPPRTSPSATSPATRTARGALPASATGAPALVSRGRPRDRAIDHRILHTTFQQLVRVGYANLSVEAVAAEAGVAKTSIYRRYPTKRDLVVAAFGEDAPFTPPPANLPARQALDQFVRQAITSLIDTGAVRILGSLLVEEQREPGVLHVFRQRLLGPRREMVIQMLQRGIERGEIRPDVDPLVVTEMIAGAVFGHHVILGLSTTEMWIDSLVEHVWTAIATN